ncbi:HET-domain-containing protein [Ganoderma leucocontextum]|nr:HET-domain-containing protein [Ganoderma leucocontextum]
MRLLDTVTGHFLEKDPCDRKTKYAILSHAWDSKGEQTYQELKDIQKRSSSAPSPSQDKSLSNPSPSQPLHDTSSTTDVAPVSIPARDASSASSETVVCPIWDDLELSPKIRDACAVARANGYRYLWIDSCCIDKTSSSELSEAINSMYQWYARAEVCYAFLADVPANGDHQRKGSHFRRSRWFTRGWTLQELIAPMRVEFLAMDWTSIGSKRGLASLVSKITNVNYSALLLLEPLSEFSVAQRLSWASRRQTTRAEDRAYCLLGLFDIHMPALYGEGDRAFRRLQEEIMRRIPDQSLFAWSWNNASLGLHTLRLQAEQRSGGLPCEAHNRQYGGMDTSLLAPSLDLFVDCRTIRAVSHEDVVRRLQSYPDLHPADYDFTPHGIRTQLPVIPLSLYFLGCATEYAPVSRWYLLILGCEHRDLPGHLLGRVCHIPASGSAVQWLYCGRVTVSMSGSTKPSHSCELLPLLPAAVSQLRSPQIGLETVYIPHSDRTDGVRAPGLGAALREPHETIRLVLLTKTPTHFPTITIEYRHTLSHNGRHLLIEAHVKSSGNLELYPDVVTWTDSCPWARALDKRVVDHYIPYIEICDDSSTVTLPPPHRRGSSTTAASAPVGVSSRTGKDGKKKEEEEEEEDEGGTTSRAPSDVDFAADGAPSWWAVPPYDL